MPEMHDTLDQLKQQWQELNLRTDNLEVANRELSERLSRGHVTTTQQRLARDTRRWSINGLLMIILAWPLTEICNMPWWVAVIYAVFGLIMAIVIRLLSRYIESERLVDLPVTEAYERACMIRRRQWYCRIVGIICGTMVLSMMFYYMYIHDEVEMLWASGAGLVIGLIIGLFKAFYLNRMSRQLIDDFKD